MRRWRAAVLALLAGLGLACGCGPAPPTGPAPTAPGKPDPDLRRALPNEGAPPSRW